MQKVGEYWVPDIDMRPFRNRRKTLANYQNGGHGKQIHHLTQALDHIRAQIGAEAIARATALDIGANVGAYARLMAQAFNHVHAFELAPDTAECLVRNVRDWGLADRITAHNKGVSDAEAMVGMGGAGWFRRSISREIRGSGTIPVIPVDTLGLTDVLFVKLDVEGHEFKALKGAARTLAAGRPYVMMELKQRHIDKGKADLTAHEHLLSMGYRIVADLGTPVLDRLYAPKDLA